MKDLTGWDLLVYEMIKKKFGYNTFTLTELYMFEENFKAIYSNNYHIKDKIRQVLQHLRDFNLLEFSKSTKGEYKLVNFEKDINDISAENINDVIYLITNESMPNWINIGHTSSILEKLQTINKNFIPAPFILKRKIVTNNKVKTNLLLSLISNAISISNKFSENKTDENLGFYNITEEQGIKIFDFIEDIYNN